jgi:hypothetical protein
VRPTTLASACTLACVAATALACATNGNTGPHRSLGRLWNQYEGLADERALAIAGDPDRVWVAGMAGGHPSRLEAEQSALARCRSRRVARRLQVSCRLYASGDEIVWQGP